MFFKRDITKKEKVQALKTAISLRYSRHYFKSRELCKEHGISNETFSKLLVAVMHKGKKQ